MSGYVHPASPDALERERWETERAFRERELNLKEREQQSRDDEVAIAKHAHAASRWRSPLIVAILAATVAALGNAFVAYTNNLEQRRLDAQQSEEARILEMIKTGSPDKAAANLRFLLQAGLINDRSVRRQLTVFLSKRKPGSGPSLPSSNAASIVSRFEGIRDHAYRDPLNQLAIGSSHLLTPTEQSTGILVIGGKRVPWRHGITPAQAKALLDQDLEPARQAVDSLVRVKLTKNQRDALTSFVSNLGPETLRRSQLLRKLNAGHYEQVPAEMMKWDRAGGVVLPGLATRRRAEVALWKQP
jgi:GH24 family phage-related lysozyme (muramidase)